jgi:hypothetical protein
MKKMKIKGSELKQIVQEELDNLMLDEGFGDWAMAAGRKIGSAFSGTDKPDAPLAKPDEPTGKEPLDPTESPVQALGQTAIKQAAKDKKFYGDKPDAQKAHSAAMDTYHNAPDDRTRFDAVNTSRTARGKDPRQWGDTAGGKFQGRMGFGRGSKEHDAYTQDVIATTGGPFRDPDDPAPASDPKALAAANARLNAYRSGQGGYGAKSGFTPAGHHLQESTQIKGSELKQIVQEELTKLLSEGDNPWGPYDADADEWYEYRHMADQDMWHQPAHSGHLVSPGGDTPEDIAKQMIESGVSVTDETASDAALNAGVLDDDLPDFVDAITMSAEELQPQGNF